MDLPTPTPLTALPVFDEIEHIAVGVFDGFHLGHRAVIDRLLAMSAQREKIAVLTFEPHPLQIISPSRAPARLTASSQRAALLKEAGIEKIITLHFDEATRNLSAEEFIHQLHHLFPNLHSVTVGKGWSFGKGKSGNAALLKKMGKLDHFSINEIEPVYKHDVAISSTAIRTALMERRFDFAADLLGRSYAIEGTVIKGESRGKEIGFPTANLGGILQLIPSKGVYACQTEILNQGGTLFPSIANIGERPTFSSKKEIAFEVHLLKFKGDLYGQQLRVSSFAFIREEQKFESADALKAQIQKDIQGL